MDKKLSFRKENLPTYIERLKTVVDKDLEIMTMEVENDIDSDKYYNILKGRRMAANDAVSISKKIDSLLKDTEGIQGGVSSHYRDIIPKLIISLKQMYELNFEVLNLNNDFVSEEKLHNVIRSRKEAAEDCDWVMEKIDELETELNTKVEEDSNKSWAIKGLVEE